MIWRRITPEPRSSAPPNGFMLIAELFVTRSLATNRERLNELKAAEAAGGGRANIDSILRALVGPTLRGCLGRERSAAARFMIRASIESVPPIRRIKNR